jgi:central glycolytic genes regulator
MRQILDIQKQLLPDLTDVLKKRYSILHHIHISGSIGRRTLAANLNLSERVLRAEVDFLREQRLLDMETSGMGLTESGIRLLEDMEPLIKHLFGLSDLEEQLKQRFGLKQVVVVPGDWDQSVFTKKELGRAGAAALRKHATKDDVIAVTGGSTLAEIAGFLTLLPGHKGSTFVPARGGLGERVELQANTIASTMAKKTGGQYRLLHVPDHLGEETYQSLMQDTNIQELVNVIRGSRIVVHGIGDAILMAKRRKVDPLTIESLQREGAMAEAFGYYFDRQGKVVHRMPTVGLRLEDIQNTEIVIGVAGGRSKAEAINAVIHYGHNDVLVTDEAAALEIIKH